jgi:hypothetical protein
MQHNIFNLESSLCSRRRVLAAKAVISNLSLMTRWNRKQKASSYFTVSSSLLNRVNSLKIIITITVKKGREQSHQECH